MKKLNRKQIISNLHKELKKLEQGKVIDIEITPKPIKVPVRISWQEDTTAQYSFDNFNKEFTYMPAQAYDYIDNACKPELTLFNKQIKQFIEKSDNFAKHFGEDKDEFFQAMIRYGLDKENKLITKRNLTKQINNAKKQLKDLETQLANI